MRGVLTGRQRMRLASLFDMLYTPAELALEIGISPRQFYRVYFPAGCPCVRSGGRLLFLGSQFS